MNNSLTIPMRYNGTNSFRTQLLNQQLDNLLRFGGMNSIKTQLHMLKQNSTRSSRIVDPITAKYKFNQLCGLWTKPCMHGYGYIHLSSATVGARIRCCHCANGLLPACICLLIFSKMRCQLPTAMHQNQHHIFQGLFNL